MTHLPLLPARIPQRVGGVDVNTVYCTDALSLLARLPDASVDMILCDPPYGVHEMEWDVIPDLTKMFEQMNRVIHPLGSMVITSQQPFTTDCINANRRYFKYETIWHKPRAGDIFNAKNKPLRAHENILVFSKGITANGDQNALSRMRYYPQGTIQAKVKHRQTGGHHIKPRPSWKKEFEVDQIGYPQSVITFMNHENERLHVNQKPVYLFEYLVSTYTLADMLVVDPFLGSGTTAVAARNLGRRYIGCDISPEYVAIARRRLAQPYTPLMFTDDQLAG